MKTASVVSPMRGKVVVLTGASAGIGEALAIAMAKQGAKLVLGARDEAALGRVADACIAEGGEAIAVRCDVTSQDDCEELMQRAVARFSGIDVLVANAGISMWARFRDVEDLSLFERLMRVNYLGAVYCTHYALPELEKRKGLIVAVSSLTGKTGVPTRSGYAASKHAMQGFFDSLRIELRDSGVDVLVVSPGFVATDIRARALGGDGNAKGESPRDEATGATMSLEECTRQIMDAIAHRRRELVMTRTARVGQWVKLLAPGLVDAIAARAVREKRGG